MFWFTLDERDYRHSLKEMDKQRDRGAGIIAASILQDHVLAAIKTRINRGGEIETNMFKQSGALGSFGTQIDLGFLLGIYPNEMRERMHLIRLVRNEFAHNPLPVSFRSQRERCAKLKLKRGTATAIEKEILDMAEQLTGTRHRVSGFRSSNNPRIQFLSAAMHLTMYLTFQTTIARFKKNWTKRKDQAPQPASLDKSGLPRLPRSRAQSQKRKVPSHRPEASQG